MLHTRIGLLAAGLFALASGHCQAAAITNSPPFLTPLPRMFVYDTYAGADLPLLPDLSASAAVPGFTLDFQNDSAQKISVLPLLENVTLLLDGREYKTRGVVFFGYPYLAANQARAFTFLLTDFTLFNDAENWPLKTGRHTAVIRFGSKRFGPLRFIWNVKTPLVK